MEHYYQRFFEYVAEVLLLPEADKTSIRRLFKPFFVPKNTIIEPAGEVPPYHNFIVSGYMRNFHLDPDDNEITTDLNDGSRFFTSYFHFMNRTVSNENLHCITDCELLRISRDDVEVGAQNSQTQKDYTTARAAPSDSAKTPGRGQKAHQRPDQSVGRSALPKIPPGEADHHQARAVALHRVVSGHYPTASEPTSPGV